MIQKIKSRIFEILETSSADLYSRIFGIFIMSLISLNVLAVILETVESISIKYELFFTTFEVFSVAVFTVEYLLRLWTCTSNKRFANPYTGRVRFAVTPLAIIDLMAVLPFYLPLIFPFDLRFIRILRLFRLFRAFKMVRYSESLKILGNVLKAKKEEIIITLFVVLILLVFSSSLIYLVEHEAQPQAFSSIPASMWWGIITLATVGYGDIYPITPIGKFLGAIIALLGVGLFALPTGILASGFVEEIRKKRGKQICPYCGREIGKL